MNPRAPRIYLQLVACLSILANIAPSFAGGEENALFEGERTLLRPKDYREWVFVGSSLGLRYSAKATADKPGALEFKNIYINPSSYRAFLKTGAFPQRTIFVLESAAGENKKEPGLQGSFQKQFTGLAAAVKDSARFQEEWAYFTFSEAGGTTSAKAQPAAKSACYDCHHQNANTDNVFTQFYPVLKLPE